MRKTFTKLMSLSLVSLALLVSKPATAQDLGEFFQAGAGDAEALLGAYLQPLGQSFGVNMNSGWINAGHPMKGGRFELKFVTPITFIPNSRKYFNPSDLDLSNGWSFSNNTEMPTFFAPSSPEESATFSQPISGTNESAEVSIPVAGIGLPVNFLPPTAQLSVGLVKGTEIMIRFMPTVSADVEGFGDFSFGTWGVGVKHDVGQWIPVIKRLPFTLGASASFSRLNTTIGYNYVPQVPQDGELNSGESITQTGLNQQGVFRANAWHVGVYASKKIPVITVYGGFRLMGSGVVVGIEGIHEYLSPTGVNQSNNNVQYDVERVPTKAGSDYIADIRMPLTQVGVTGGLRLKLGIITLFAEGNLSRYSTVSLGAGIGWID